MTSKPSQADIQDESRLAELGYRQDLKRDWTLLHNFGISFSIIVSHHGRMRGKNARIDHWY